VKYIGPAFSFINLAREMRVAPIKKQAEEPVQIGLVGPAGPRLDAVLRALAGALWTLATREGTLRHLPTPLAGASLQALSGCHLVIVIGEGEPAQMVDQLATARLNAGALVPMVWLLSARFWGDEPAPPALVGPGAPQRVLVVPEGNEVELRLKLGHAVVELTPNPIGTGRRLPPLRRFAADRIINETARGNAEFAAFSNIPALLPVIGNFFEATADMIVLTKNQVWMIYKLAGLYDRDLQMRGRILLEIAPVIGGGFLWRTIARELSALLPGLLGAVPKVLIAYVGTYTIGKAAAYYYQEGRRPPKALVQSFYRDAIARARRLQAYVPSRFRRQPPALPAPSEGAADAAAPAGELVAPRQN
jgi:uncharacterized protein (DUF697 family)